MTTQKYLKHIRKPTLPASRNHGDKRKEFNKSACRGQNRLGEF